MSKSFTYRGLDYDIRKGYKYCLEPCFLDIETSNNHAEKPEDLITWITSIQVIFHGEYFLFRYPEELIEWYEKLYKKYNLYPTSKLKVKFITYIHNASYDLSYLIPYLLQLPDFGETSQGIIEGQNKFLSFVQGSLEFRCSYRLSGMSLEKWSNEMNIEHKKQVGLYDYDAIIYPDEELSEDNKKYDYYDVLAMQECLAKQMEYHNDILSTIPLTSTGYIRRTLRRSCLNNDDYRDTYFYNNRLTAESFEYCQNSYAGGFTHNNRFYKNRLIQCGRTYRYNNGVSVDVKMIKHRDFKSHYPTQMTCNDTFPIGVPQKIYDNATMPFELTIDTILSWYPEYTSFCFIRFYSATLKDENNSMPFMQFSKCCNSHFKLLTLDNGRIIEANGEWFMYLDNLTLSILHEDYNLTYEVIGVYRMKNGRLPDCIISVIDKYFKGKSDKKNIVHELTNLYGKLDNRTRDAEFRLMQDKKGLNGIYGCCSTSPLQDSYRINEYFEFYPDVYFITMEAKQAGLDKFYRGYNNFLAFQFGCMVTSMARFELHEYIKTIGYENCLYADTDSCFYISTPEIEEKIEQLNKIKREKAHKVILDNGKEEYYDEFCLEPDILAFKGLHSKCYGVVTEKGLEVTIAGVPDRTLIEKKGDKLIYYTREEELAGGEKDPIKALNKLEYGFKFKVNTGISALYVGANGYKTPRVPQILNVNGHEIHTAGGCVIRRLESKEVKDVDMNCKNINNSDESVEISQYQ